MDSFMRSNGATAGRGNYRRAMDAEELLYKARAAISRLFDIENPSRVVFTSNATESINLALKGLLKPGDNVITSNLEHNSVWRPLKTMERDRGITISELRFSPDGRVDVNSLHELIGKNTKLICIMHASNVLGNILPVDEITEIAHSHNVPVLIDAAQSAGVLPISVGTSGFDLLAFTGHKGLLGPMGTGGLYIREGIDLDTLKEGGTGSSSSLEFQPKAMPDKYEVGTHNVAGLAGLLAAVEYIEKTGVQVIRAKEEMMTGKMLELLSDIPELILYGPEQPENRVGLVSFNLWNKVPEDIGSKLDEQYGIMTRGGVHCSPQAHKVIGTEKTGAIRASISYFNEMDDILALANALDKLAK